MPIPIFWGIVFKTPMRGAEKPRKSQLSARTAARSSFGTQTRSGSDCKQNSESSRISVSYASVHDDISESCTNSCVLCLADFRDILRCEGFRASGLLSGITYSQKCNQNPRNQFTRGLQIWQVSQTRPATKPLETAINFCASFAPPSLRACAEPGCMQIGIA